MNTKKTNSKEIPNSSPSRAKAKRKAVVRKMYQRLKIDGSNYIVARDEPSFEFTEPVYVIRESDLPEVIERMAKGMYAQCNTVDTWKTTSQARREAVLETSRAGFASLGIPTGGART